MNEKLESIIARLSEHPSTAPLARELRDVLEKDCIVVDKAWFNNKIESKADEGLGKVWETFGFSVHCAFTLSNEEYEDKNAEARRRDYAVEQMAYLMSHGGKL